MYVHKSVISYFVITYVSFRKQSLGAHLFALSVIYENIIAAWLLSFCFFFIRTWLSVFSDIQREGTKTDKTETKSRKVSFSRFSIILLLTTGREIAKKSFHAYLCTYTMWLNASNDKL